MLSSSDSDSNNNEWMKSRKKRSKVDQMNDAPEEGEVSSGTMDDDGEDIWDENLVGGEEDQQRLFKMSEKEREEELFKRAEKRDAMVLRKAFLKKLKQKKEKEKAEKSSKGSSTQKSTGKSVRKSAYSNVFGSDSDEVDVSDNDFTPAKSKQRKLALEKSKGTSEKLKELVELRKQQQKRNLSSAVDEEDSRKSKTDDSDEPKSNSKQKDKRRAGVKLIYSSDSSESEHESSNEMNGLKSTTIRRQSSSSSLSSAISSSDESSDDDVHRGRSRSPEEEMVTTSLELSKIRLSRHKLEKWVHMPFFNSLVSGCFVRINIGINQGVSIYRCAEIVDVVETPKVYELGNTRTNKSLVVKASKHQSPMRMAFVSNSDFSQSEFDSWYRRTKEDGYKTPTLQFIQRKAKEIEKVLHTAITDEKTVDQIVQSKKRFQKVPTNYAMKKAELIKLKEISELEGDTGEVKRLESELKEIDSQAEKIERKRTVGFKSIKTINQRNRLLSVQQVEEAIKRETLETLNAPEEDPFTRIQSRPVIWTKKNFDLIKNQKSDEGVGGNSQKQSDATQGKSADHPKSAPKKNPAHSNSNHSLHDIHNFEIDISVDLGLNNGGGVVLEQNNINGIYDGKSRSDNLLVTNMATPVPVTNSSKQSMNRRMLNLEEYKRSRGLI